MLKRIIPTSLFAAAGIAVYAAPLTPGNLLLVRVGNGTETIDNPAAHVFLDEITTSGTLVQTIALPGDAGAATNFTISGKASSEGALTVYNNTFALAGYNVAAGAASATFLGATAAAANRVVALVDLSGNVDLSTKLTDAYDKTNIRGAVSDGTKIWLAGSTGSPATAGGIRYTTKGATTTTQLFSGNMRRVDILNGAYNLTTNVFSPGAPQLYAGAGAAAWTGVGAMGVGLPTTAPVGPAAFTAQADSATGVSGTNGATNQTIFSSPYDFYITPEGTLYLTDDRTADLKGGLIKRIPDTTLAPTQLFGPFVDNYLTGFASVTSPVLNGGTTTEGTRSLTYAGKDGGGNNTFYVVNGTNVFIGSGTTGNSLSTFSKYVYKLVDVNGTPTISLIYTAPNNVNIRGIRVIPGTPGVTLAGNLTLGNYTLAGTVPAQFKIYSGGVLKSTVTSNVTVNSSGVGTYSINAGSVSGSIDVYCVINGGTFLQKKNTVSVSGTSASSDFSLINGDIDGNNIVNINDYSVLSDHFNAPAGDPNYVANADLDKNGTININDYSILSDNFNLAGDVAP